MSHFSKGIKIRVEENLRKRKLVNTGCSEDYVKRQEMYVVIYR